MNLFTVLNEYYDGQWSIFPSPTNTIDDYDNIIWLNEIIPTREEIQAKIAELEAAEPLRLLRLERDRILAKYDWITIRAYSQGTEVPMEWQTYLQQLRDLPATAEPQLNENGELTNVIWPTPPE